MIMIMMMIVTMALYERSQEPWRYPFGGSERSRRISLQSTVCQVMSAALYCSHPRKMSLLPTVNSIYGALRHIDGRFGNFLNLHGIAVR
jgi:hypothetical protein